MTPVFVLCAMRSYSSLICAMLGQHPQFFGVPELNLAVADRVGGMLEFYARRPHGLHGLLRTVAQLQSGAQTDDTIEAAHAWVLEREDWSTARMLRWIQDAVAPKRLVDKSPVLVRSVEMLERLHRMAPDAHFLHIVRQPGATCRSIGRLHEWLDAETGSSLRERVDPEQVWLRSNANILTFQSRLAPGRCLTLQGEAFLAEFEDYAPQVCEWLEVGGDESALDAMRHPERSSFAGFGPEAALYGNDPNFLGNPVYVRQPIAIEDIDEGFDGRAFKPRTRKIARQLGYS